MSPSLETLEKLAKAFGLAMSTLLDFEKSTFGKSKEELFQEFSRREIETIKKAIEGLRRVFGKE